MKTRTQCLEVMQKEGEEEEEWEGEGGARGKAKSQFKEAENGMLVPEKRGGRSKV